MPESITLRVEPTLGQAAVEALHRGLDQAEADSACRVVILEGAAGVFCNGMDLDELSTRGSDLSGLERFPALLRRFASLPRVVIAAVDGKVTAGGLGLVAAADLAYLGPRATFSLSETLFGLLPAVIAPYLVRRVGFQKAYELTLTGRTVLAEEAVALHLGDALVNDVSDHVRLQVKRLARLDPLTITDAKAYFGKLWILSAATEETALDELKRLLGSERVRKNIEGYTKLGRMPWEAP